MIDKVLKFFLLISPLCYIFGESLNKFDTKVFHIFCISLFIGSLYDYQKRSMRSININKPVLYFFLICLFSIMTFRFNDIIVATTIEYFLALYCMVMIFKYAKDPKEYYNFIVYACVINMTIFVIQYLGYNPILKNSHKVLYGANLGNIPRLTTYFAIISPILYSNCLVALILAIIIAFLNEPQFASIGIMIMIIFINVDSKLFRCAVIALGVYFLAKYHAKIIYSFKVRGVICKPVIDDFFNRPLIGYGIGVFPYAETTDPLSDKTLNSSVILFGVRGGILMFVWMGYIFKIFYKNFKKTIPHLCVLSIYILSFVEYPIEIKKLWITMISLMAFSMIEIYKNKEIKKNG